MAIYKLGSRGDEVREIQRKLSALGDYRGPIDGDFGGGTQAAVVAFQRRKGIEADGSVQPATWEALFGSPIPKPAIGDKDLAYRCLALTGSFETGTGIPDCFCGISGDFDGQGISFGVLQWNFGQGTLQPLKMVIVANRRAEAANPRWIDDVRVRKLCIARGEGTVHGIPYRLDDQYAIGLKRFAA